MFEARFKSPDLTCVFFVINYFKRTFLKSIMKVIN